MVGDASEHRMTVFACWEKSRQEWPDDPERQKFRFVELMREQGRVIKGKQEPLPCGWRPGGKR